MNCEPNALAAAAKCYCLPPGKVRQVWTYLLCQWANKQPGPPPGPTFSYIPDTSIITWTDTNGAGQNGNLAFFNATADIPSVSAIDLNSQGITSITGLQALPALASATLGNNLMTSLDASGCASLTFLSVDNNALTSLDVTGDLSLSGLSCSVNALAVLNVAGNTALNSLDCHANPLLTLNVTPLVALTSLRCQNCLLSSLDLHTCTLLTIVNCNFNLLTTINVAGCVVLVDLRAAANHLTVLGVNTVLSDLVANGQTGGTVLLQLQTPAAPPSVGPPNGIAAKATLLAEVPAWTVSTD